MTQQRSVHSVTPNRSSQFLQPFKGPLLYIGVKVAHHANDTSQRLLEAMKFEQVPRIHPMLPEILSGISGIIRYGTAKYTSVNGTIFWGVAGSFARVSAGVEVVQDGKQFVEGFHDEMLAKLIHASNLRGRSLFNERWSCIHWLPVPLSIVDRAHSEDNRETYKISRHDRHRGRRTKATVTYHRRGQTVTLWHTYGGMQPQFSRSLGAQGAEASVGSQITWRNCKGGFAATTWSATAT
jgi:hypothetical protein